ncbi:MAG TPA: ATP-binding protein [Bacteriovoracaceae bacterium]|nr:ATP-binding protein [Bacteriovoracaceae bacterium]
MSDLDSSIATLSSDGKVIKWNMMLTELTGYESNEILGKHFRILNSVENLRRKKSEEVLKWALSEGKVYYEDWHVKKDGAHFWASMNVTAIYDNGEKRPTFFLEMRQASQTNQVAEKFRARSAELEKKLGDQTIQLDERTSQLSAKTKQFDVAEALNVSLEGQLGERTSELGFQTSELGERTFQLSSKTKEFNTVETLNKELEAFTYAASHDLRAPLRSIDGYSQILLDEYSDKLDEAGQGFLTRIRINAQKMAQLIDDLIGLSSLTRGELKRSTCDLTAECKLVAAELMRAKPERKVEFFFSDLMQINCDVPLIHVVLENLIGNAFKYTSKIPLAKIEVGFMKMAEGNIYFVKDNGAGFDMEYAHKLFAPFQRLHAVTDFEGNGIGLATVQRIIHRHGGEVWVESEVDKGTTFFFTI